MKQLRVRVEIEVPCTPRTMWIRLSADGALLATRDGSTITVWSTRDLDVVRTIRVPAIDAASAWAIAPNGAQIAVAKLQHVALLDVDGATIAETDLPDGTDAPREIVFNRAGTRVFASSELGEDEDADVDGLVSHVFALDVPSFESLRRGWVQCSEEMQAQRVVAHGDGGVFRIGCGQDGAWAYAFAPSDDDARFDIAPIGVSADLVDIGGFADDAGLVVFSDHEILRLGWPKLDVVGDATFPDGATLAQYGDARDGVAFAPVTNGDAMELIAYDATSLDVIARWPGGKSSFVGAANDGRAIVCEISGDRATIRLLALE